MSTIDQAFIKAYGDDTDSSATGRVQARGPAKQSAAATTRHQAKTTAQHGPGRPASTIVGPHSRFQAQPANKQPKAVTETTMPATIEQRKPKMMPAQAAAAAPLSTFAPPQPAVAPFRPALEVDNFVWPSICDALDSKAADGFDGLTEELIGGVSLGHSVVAITGCRRGEGRSSMLLCLARHLSARGLKICLVDADFDNGQLSRQLGMAVEAGLEAIVNGDLPVTEVLIESLADHMALLPLHGRVAVDASSSASLRLVETFQVLREQYDLVLVDTGPLLEGSQSGLHLVREDSGIDAAVLVSDLRHGRNDQMMQVQRLLNSAGVELLGVAENFAAQPIV